MAREARRSAEKQVFNLLLRIVLFIPSFQLD